MATAELVNLFAVPFALCRCPSHARLNPALKQYILVREQTGASNPRPLTQRNAAVYESDFNLFRDAEPAVQELKAFCWEQLLGVIARLNGYDLPTLQRLQIYNDCWFHVTRRGGFFDLHNHPNASWSGVYCVDPGEHDPAAKQSGLLNFVNPMLTCAMHLDAAVARMQLPYGYHNANLRLEAGQLVLFPSWLLHDVKPYEGPGERITVAFNCWFTLPDARESR
jgi:uncharacterized protein (TIGR02466 family)